MLLMRLMLMMLQATGASGLWRLVAAADAHDAPAADAHDAPGYGGFWAVEACGSGWCS